MIIMPLFYNFTIFHNADAVPDSECHWFLVFKASCPALFFVWAALRSDLQRVEGNGTSAICREPRVKHTHTCTAAK